MGEENKYTHRRILTGSPVHSSLLHPNSISLYLAQRQLTSGRPYLPTAAPLHRPANSPQPPQPRHTRTASCYKSLLFWFHGCPVCLSARHTLQAVTRLCCVQGLVGVSGLAVALSVCLLLAPETELQVFFSPPPPPPSVVVLSDYSYTQPVALSQVPILSLT